ncbi:MAG: M50 family metallopeptidase [Kiritimatiellaeota bacterium]|nr:M50 family metallopeptidase [Kiritimatiellota bacterium]
MKSSLTLFRIFGIPVTVDLSLLILLFILVSSFGSLPLGIMAGLILLVSILLHELGHSLVSMAFGGKVRDIRLMMLGGCATMTAMPKKAWQEILMAFAGPFVSIMLAGISFILFYSCLIPHLGNETLSLRGFWEISLMCTFPSNLPKVPFVCFVSAHAAWLNVALFCFNMLPAFPMDGGRILRAMLQQFFTTRLKATWIASRLGRFVAILMGLHVLYSALTGSFRDFMFIRLMIALMIYQTAEREYLMALAEAHGTRRNPFAGFPFFSRGRRPPPDDGQAIVSPPPYDRGTTRVDIHKDDSE